MCWVFYKQKLSKYKFLTADVLLKSADKHMFMQQHKHKMKEDKILGSQRDSV